MNAPNDFVAFIILWMLIGFTLNFPVFLSGLLDTKKLKEALKTSDSKDSKRLGNLPDRSFRAFVIMSTLMQSVIWPKQYYEVVFKKQPGESDEE